MSNASARNAILSRLYAACPAQAPAVAPEDAWSAPILGTEECIEAFCQRMRAVRTEVHRIPAKQWQAKVAEVLAEKRAETVSCGPGAWFAKDLAKLLAKAKLPAPLVYDKDVEALRDQLFLVDASVTSALAGIAETGGLVLAPDQGEPRLLSLVPPLHIVLLRAADVRSSFAQAITELNLAGDMPSNLVLVSGPSKTADIEMVLTFGVHGPKDLVVLVLE